MMSGSLLARVVLGIGPSGILKDPVTTEGVGRRIQSVHYHGDLAKSAER